MKVLLVNPPSVNLDRSEVAPPLGLYALAAVTRQAGQEALVWDGNIVSRNRRSARFLDDFEQILTEYRPDVVAATSMVINTHVALAVLRRARELLPQTVTVAGGPHFSAFAEEAADSYPWIDHIVKGEGEAAFDTLLRSIASGARLLTRVLAAPVSARLLTAIRPSFDDVPWPAYFKANPRRTADYESSRGCVFRCSFCYSPGQWGPKPRYVDEEVVIEDLRALASNGVRHVFFIDDNFLNDLSRAQRLCGLLAAAQLELRWFCYATLNRLDPVMIDQLVAAGCDGVFVGIDALSSATQQAFKKGFFKGGDDATKRLRYCVDSGIQPTCALIARPEADEEELDAIISFAAHLRELGCSVRLNPLIGYQATPFAPQADSSLFTDVRIRLMLDASPLLCENEFARRRPHLFPYHCSTRDPAVEEAHLRNIHAAATLIRHFPRTLVGAAIRGALLWRRILEVASAVRGVNFGSLRRSEREVAASLFGAELTGESASVTAGEFLISALRSRRNWVRVAVRVGSRDRMAAVRPFLLDASGLAPRLLVAAFGPLVRIFELDAHVNRSELVQLSAASRKTGRFLRPNKVGPRTVAALLSGGLLRFPKKRTITTHSDHRL